MVGNMRSQMNPGDYPTAVGKLVPRLTGPPGDVIARRHVDLTTFATHDRVYEFLRWLPKVIGIDQADEKTSS